MAKPNTIAAIELRTNYGTMKIKNNKILQFNEKTDVKDIWMNGGIYHLNTTHVQGYQLKVRKQR